MPKRKSTLSSSPFYLLCTATLVPVLLFCSLILSNDWRMWSIAWWNLYSLETALLLFVVCLAFLTAVWFVFREIVTRPEAMSGIQMYVVTSLGLLLTFVLFRTQTHFLGDGYALLGVISSDTPFLKERNFGGMLIPYGLMNILGGSSPENALLSYRIASIVSGIAFMIISYGIAQTLRKESVERFLFWVGLILGGYSLLFFGYVENYGPFVVAVALFCYTGLRVEKSELRWWWLIPAWILCPVMHVFGLALFPAFLYLALKSAPEGSFLCRTNVRMLTWLVAGGAGLSTLVYLYATNLFFRFSFVPTIANRITVEGYTLFSSAHLLDFANLLLVLSPALLLSLLFGVGPFLNGLRNDIFSYRFLTLASLSLLAVAFFINPLLGMPRDWDLFAATGVPLTIVVLLTLAAESQRKGRMALVLAVAVSLIMLASRVAVTANVTAGSRMALDYMHLDPVKNRTFGKTYATFIQERYGTDSALAVQRELAPLWPDDLIADSGSSMMTQGAYGPAADYFGRATLMNPLNYGAWANLGKCLVERQMYDSAVSCLRTAAGLNPYNSDIAAMQGYAEYYCGHHEQATAAWLKSRQLDTSKLAPLEGLARYYATVHNEVLAMAYLDTIVRRVDAPPDYLLLRIEQLAEHRCFADARLFLQRAVQNGLDSARLNETLCTYPDLQD